MTTLALANAWKIAIQKSCDQGFGPDRPSLYLGAGPPEEARNSPGRARLMRAAWGNGLGRSLALGSKKATEIISAKKATEIIMLIIISVAFFRPLFPPCEALAP
jgi:hypothetical protein